MKRYDIVPQVPECGECCGAQQIVERPDGDWVKWIDYEQESELLADAFDDWWRKYSDEPRGRYERFGKREKWSDQRKADLVKTARDAFNAGVLSRSKDFRTGSAIPPQFINIEVGCPYCDGHQVTACGARGVTLRCIHCRRFALYEDWKQAQADDAVDPVPANSVDPSTRDAASSSSSSGPAEREEP